MKMLIKLLIKLSLIILALMHLF